ncbi:MAG: metallophosphoesterase [Acidobacteriia bacterium]|nr:metallophosphoesterase [Terriglobia bacterium]
MARLAVFLLIVLSVWTLMHAYVFFRVSGLPPFEPPTARRLLLAAAAALWLGYPLARILSPRLGRLVFPLDAAASIWVGVLFLLFVSLLAADLATGFGLLFPGRVARAREAAVAAAGLLSVAALIQGLRPPGITERTVRLEGLGPELDGLVVVQISDLHLGPLLSERWLARRVRDVEALKPDLLAVTGDLVDHDVSAAGALVPVLRRLTAPLGVFAVTGNHEFYAGLERSVAILRAAGFRVLRDEAVEAAPGLVVAGVDDLTARRQAGAGDGFLDRALASRPRGVTILLSHSPSEVERAAELGVGLMLSGHTHDGQIWPFAYLVRLAYPRLSGFHEVGGMTLCVSRGTGFWGPPMRLFRRAEIVRITLRKA